MKVFHVSIAIILSFLPTLSAHALEREKSVANCAGEVVTIKGTVLVRQDSDDAKAKAPIALKPGYNLYAGDVVNTASDGAVKILLKDKTIIDLGGSALFKVAQFKANEGANREVELDMMFGKMRVAVPRKLQGEGKFQIKTRAATMGVRGTEFVVSTALETSNENEKMTPPQTSVVVLQGKVDVAKPGESGNAGSMHLTAGNQVTTSLGAPTSAMVKLNETQLKTVSTSSKVTDNTFSRAVTIENTPMQRTSTSSTASNNGGASSSSTARSPAEASNGSGNSSATTTVAANAPLAGSIQSSMASIAAEVPTVAVSFSELGVPGATSVANAAGPVTQNKSSYHVTVVVAQ
jgi:hypothetical protein